MSERTKKRWAWATSSMVIIYAIVFFIIMAMQFGIDMLAKFEVEFHGKLLMSFINGEIALPVNTMAVIWVALCAAYCGVDRASYLVKSTTESIGECDMGDPAMLRFIILLAGLLFAIGLGFGCFSDCNYELNLLASAWGSAIVLYVAGQKGIKMAKYIDGTKKKKRAECDCEK